LNVDSIYCEITRVLYVFVVSMAVLFNSLTIGSITLYIMIVAIVMYLSSSASVTLGSHQNVPWTKTAHNPGPKRPTAISRM